jgi:hypothetical protein
MTDENCFFLFPFSLFPFPEKMRPNRTRMVRKRLRDGGVGQSGCSFWIVEVSDKRSISVEMDFVVQRR